MTALCLMLAFVAGQIATGITGVIRDPRGYPIPGATVTLTNGAGAVTQAVSDEDGRFVFSNVPAGTFTMTARLSAFARVRSP